MTEVPQPDPPPLVPSIYLLDLSIKIDLTAANPRFTQFPVLFTAPKTSFLEFLNDWLTWTERGAPQDQPYNRHKGLCYNYLTYLRAIRPYEIAGTSYNYVAKLFGTDVPFPDYGRDNYHGTMHLNPHRLAWVRLQTGRPSDV